MEIGIIINTNDAEIVWNAFRFGITALKSDHEVKIFLMSKAVEVEDIKDEKFDIKEQIEQYILNNGKILACGTCLKMRQKNETNVCPISTMKDLFILVEELEKILTFC